MANSYVVYTGNGSTGPYNVPFGYIDRAHVLVKVDGVNATFTWITASTIQLDSPAANGAVIRVYRQTSPTARLTDYTAPSALTEEDLDNDSLQAFYLCQEAVDGANEALGLNDASTDWDAESKRITNLDDATAATDAVTKSQLDAAVIAAGNVPSPLLADVGKFLKATAEGVWAWATGVVTSVALSMPSIFSVSGSPITSAGTFTVSLATQVKNRIFAGPATGADAAPTFRALVTDDIPDAGVTKAKIENVNGSKLLGRGAGVAGAPEEITLGTNLSMSGTTLNAGGGSLIPINSQTVSGVASVDFSNLLDGTYDTYVVVGENIIVSTGTSLLVRFGYGATPTYVSASYVACQRLMDSVSTTDARTTSGSNSVELTGTVSSVGFTGFEFIITGVNSTTKRKSCHWAGHTDAIAAGNSHVGHFEGAGGCADTNIVNNAVTSLRFLTGTGTITAGTFTLYGLKRS